MSFKHLLLIATLFSAVPAWCGHALTKREKRILDGWLSQHPTFRAATDADCDCSDDIQQMKTGYGGNWTPYSDYHPYIATGDFNSDGVTDFAVAVIDHSKRGNSFAVLVFNGPFSSKPGAPTYLESGLDLRGKGMFFGPPRPKPYRLVIGPFESDNTLILIPNGKRYKVHVAQAR